MAKNKFLFNNIDSSNIEKAVVNLCDKLTHETYEMQGETYKGVVIHFIKEYDKNDTNGNSKYNHKFVGMLHGYPLDITYEVAEIMQYLWGSVGYKEKNTCSRYPSKFIQGYDTFVDNLCFKLTEVITQYTNYKIITKHEIH